MAVTTITADASQCVFEFLHAELVSYMLDRPKTDKVSGLHSILLKFCQSGEPRQAIVHMYVNVTTVCACSLSHVPSLYEAVVRSNRMLHNI